jgi:hypothetical protein
MAAVPAAPALVPAVPPPARPLRSESGVVQPTKDRTTDAKNTARGLASVDRRNEFFIATTPSKRRTKNILGLFFARFPADPLRN